MKQATIKSKNTTEHAVPRLGIRIQIQTPRATEQKLRGSSKKLLDRIMTSFYQHSGIEMSEVTRRLSYDLNFDEQDISKYLYDSTLSVLGRRRLLWPWGKTVQWNPGDDSCVAGKLLFVNSRKDFVEIAGELYEVKEKSLLVTK